MAEKEPCILTNMCMVCDGDRILVQDRVHPGWSGIAFPGGHVERGESFVDSVIREVKEETGLTIANVRLCGIKQVVREDHRYIVLFFKTHTFSGELISSPEGRVFWIGKDELKNYTLANGFEQMYEVFERDDLSENFYRFEDGQRVWENK